MACRFVMRLAEGACVVSMLVLISATAAAQYGEDPPAEPVEPVEAPVEEPLEPAPLEPEPEPVEETGPVIAMPEEDQTPPPSASSGRSAEVDMMRGLQEERFERAQSTSIGGYGELHYNYVNPELGESRSQVDLHRLVLFFAHNFSEDIRFYSEVEIEHAFIEGGEESGELGVEQAYVDWRLLDDALGLRAGVILVPMGIINQWHEPPIFNGVERPSVDARIIPSTWREAGIGVFGQPIEGLRYELYLMSGLDASGFSASSGIRGGRQHIFEHNTDGLAVSGRVEYEPMLGLVAGLSGYYGHAGPNAELVTGCTEDPVTMELVGCTDFDGSVPVLGVSADARLRLSGLEARAVVAYFSIGDTEPLQTGGMDVASGLFGWYVEAGYDVLTLVDSSHQLVPFVRFEQVDTTFSHSVQALEGSRAFNDLVLGLSYRPIPQLAFKTDLILRNADADGADATLWNLGIGWMF